MTGYEIDACTGAELLRFIRALGQHRYLAGRLHLVHAFAIAAAADPDPAFAEAAAWAERALGSRAVDLGSKDERLYRRASDAEVQRVLAAFWCEESDAAKDRLRQHLAAIDVTLDAGAVPFDEAREEDIFPVLVDAGWELLPLTQLDRERHRGAIQAFDDFEVARFEEENAVPPRVTLHELPILGAVELLSAFDEIGMSRAPFVLWQDGDPTYLDYILRGALRAAKIERDDA